MCRKEHHLAHGSGVPELADIRSLDDYLAWINDLLHWVPSENVPGSEVLNILNGFHFVLNQRPILALQNPIVPSPEAASLTPLSAWMVRYARAGAEHGIASPGRRAKPPASAKALAGEQALTPSVVRSQRPAREPRAHRVQGAGH